MQSSESHLPGGYTSPNVSQAILTAIIRVAIRRPLSEIDLFFCQSFMALPNILEFSKRVLSSGEDRAKQKQARSAKGVLGKIGSGTPAMAKASDVYPALR
jgi:hypothetical protein